MIVVDSSVWVAYFNGQATREAELLDDLLGVEPIMIGDLITAEVLQGFCSDSDFREAKAALDSLTFSPMAGRQIALASARNYRKLRTNGITVRRTIDMLIASFCIENGHRLLHADRDFDVIETHLGLAVL